MLGLEEEPGGPASPKRAKEIPWKFEGADMVITERLTLGGATHVGDQDNSLKRHYFEAVDRCYDQKLWRTVPTIGYGKSFVTSKTFSSPPPTGSMCR